MNLFFKEEVPFFRFLWFFLGGISFSVVYNLKPDPLYIFYWLSVFSLLIFYLNISKKRKIYHHNWIPGFFICLCFFISGIIFTNQHKEIYQDSHFSKTEGKYLMVIIDETPRIKNDVARFTVNVVQVLKNQKTTPVCGKLLLAMRFDSSQNLSLNYGDLLLIKSKYQETEPPYNPGEFNYKRFLAFKQVYHQSFINFKETRKLSSEKGNFIIAKALKFREAQVQKFKNYIELKNSQSVASTLILGYRAELDQQILDAYQKTGTLHILSVSGMHVAIVVILLNFLFKPLENYKQGRTIKFLSMLFLIWFYSVITGLAPSILRAALMLSLMLTAKYFSTKANIYNVISISAFIILLINPLNLMDIGFQLSFLAVLGLVYLHPRIYNLFRPDNRVLDLAWQCASISIAAQIATTPISLYYFHQFPVYFIISNLFMSMPAAVIMYIGIAFLFFSPFPAIMKVLGSILNYLIDFTNTALIYIEHFPYASITNVWFSKTEIILLYSIFLMLILNISKKKKIVLVSFFALLFSSLNSYYFIQHINQHKTVFLSLRKNTAIAYIKGREALLITDLDTMEYTYRFSVKPYLDSSRVKTIRHIHPHQHKTESIYQFADKKLKVINHQQNSFTKSNSDWLLLSGDKIYQLEKIKDYCNSKYLFIDGRNRDFVIENLKNQAAALNLPTVILKRNPAVEFNH